MKYLAITLLAMITMNTMATWKAGNYMNSGLSKSSYLAKQSKPKVTTKTPVLSNSQRNSEIERLNAKYANNSGGFPNQQWSASDTAYLKKLQQMSPQEAQQQKQYVAYLNDSTDKIKNPYGSSKPSRSQAKIAYEQNNALGGKSFLEASQEAMGKNNLPGAEISQNTVVSTDSPWRNALRQGINLVKRTSPLAAGIGEGMKSVGFDLTNFLGLPAQAQTTEDYFNQLAQQEQENNIKRNVNDITGINIFNTQDSGTINRNKPVPTDTGTNNDTERSANRNRPVPVQNEIFNPTPVNNQGSISDIYSQPELIDNTPIDRRESTRRQLLGSGYLSGGSFGNGGGLSDNVNMGGYLNSVGNNSGNNWMQYQLNNLLGIPTANAQELPTRAFDQNYLHANTSPIPGFSPENQWSYQNGIPTWNDQIQTQINETTPPLSAGGFGGRNSVQTQQVKQSNSQFNPGDLSQFGYDKNGYKSQQKELKKQFDALMKQIENQYNIDREQQTGELNKVFLDNLLKQNAQFDFGNASPGDEQRIQYQQRLQNDQAGQLAKLLTSLANSRTQSQLSAKQNYSGGIQDILKAQRGDYNTAMTNARNYQTQLAKTSGRGVPKEKVPTKNDIGGFIQDAMRKGYTWEEIAQDLDSQNIPTFNGSTADLLLRRAFNA